MLRLTIVGEDGATLASREVDVFPCRIGRAEESDLRIDHPSLSARHAMIERTSDGLRVRDLGSTNGTFFRSSRATEFALRGTGSFFVGRIELRFHCEDDGAERTREMPPLARAMAFGSPSVPAPPMAAPRSFAPVTALGRLGGLKRAGAGLAASIALHVLFTRLEGGGVADLLLGSTAIVVAILTLSAPFAILARVRGESSRFLEIASWAAWFPVFPTILGFFLPMIVFHLEAPVQGMCVELAVWGAMAFVVGRALARVAVPDPARGLGATIAGGLTAALFAVGIIGASDGFPGFTGRLSLPLRSLTQANHPMTALGQELDRALGEVDRERERDRKPATEAEEN
jgi:hypothetical protein